MESKEPTNEKIIEAVKSYYGLKIDEDAYGYADVMHGIMQMYMLTKKQLLMDILYM